MYSSVVIASSRLGFILCVMFLAWLIDFRAGFKALWERISGLRRIVALLAIVFIIQALAQRGGEVILDIGILRVHSQGLYAAAVQCLRLIVIYWCATSLSRLDFTMYKIAFSKLHLPEEISFMVSYMAHLIPDLRSRFTQQNQELRLRGIQFKSCSWKHKLEIYRILAFGILSEVLHDSTRQAISLELRGFRSQGKRSNLNQQSLRGYDALIIAGLPVLLIVIRYVLLP
jgi:energy-coupling factor transporter transmembrane protein EcfT